MARNASIFASAAAVFLAAAPALAFVPRPSIRPFPGSASDRGQGPSRDPSADGRLDDPASNLAGADPAGKEFLRSDLVLDSENVPIREDRRGLAASPIWSRFFQDAGHEAEVFLDPRTAHPTNIVLLAPLLPGDGLGNTLTLADVGARLRQSLGGIDADLVARLVRLWIEEHADVLGVAVDQLGDVRAAPVGRDLWNVSVPQTSAGIPVRGARLAGVISHGNLVMIGTSDWSDVRIATTPALTDLEAIEIGLGYAGGAARLDAARPPKLEIVPVDIGGHDLLEAHGSQHHEAPGGGERNSEPSADPEHSVSEPVVGLGHRLVWTFGVVMRGGGDGSREGSRSLPGEDVGGEGSGAARAAQDSPSKSGDWEAMVDARTGELLAFQDTTTSLERRIVGGVYPLTSTGICPSPDRCGAMQSGTPMPFADTALPPPDAFTNSAGIVDGPGGTMTTTLTGTYVRIVDACGPLSESTAASLLDLGGVNGQHDCVSGGASPGNTPAARTSFYEINKLVEAARGWLPSNLWLQAQLLVNVNINGTCGASYSPTLGTLSFYRSGSGCRNSGEIAGVFAHEWGHGLDDNDSAGVLSNSTEAYADMAAIYRLRTSCVGYGFYATANSGCGMTSDGTGFNANEAQVGGSHCDLDCSGVRDADWDRHADHAPDTALGFVCGRCATGSGPCGRQTHCGAAPSTQAGWDFAARDLQAPPFAYTPERAFIVANRIFYQGSGNVGLWHACTCGVSSSGCGATNAYMNWLAADDDNGNILDGTPHMTALFSAFNRHGIACATPSPVNSGCAGGPSGAPAVTLLPGGNAIGVEWTAVPGAAAYWVLRSEGHAGCGGGFARVAVVAGTSYTDLDVANGRTYAYVVMPQSANEACQGAASACALAMPQACDLGEVPASVVWTGGGKDTLSWSAVAGASAYRIHEGDGASLPSLITPAEDSCVRATVPGTTSGPVLDETPPPGSVLWFLVTAARGLCEGSAGSATAGPRVLDSSGACP